ncbi:MAG: PSD1 and planctomycete cytochrome C domain-containing protein, partial [Candidatus Hydrogenedentes bacterium]|nr:PSD1 and planctomycete cytochrome C domain-containing protein [Candidatus Hydrogenedentota bacterium]
MKYMQFGIVIRVFWGVIVMMALQAGAGNFNTKVKPILSQHCFTCHGPDAKQRKADLRLDVAPDEGGIGPERLRKIFGSGRHSSLFFARITTEDGEDRMPPSEKPGLSSEEIAVLGQWLDEGAAYEKHWAFVPPAWPEIPAVKNPSWPRNDIDNFVLARLEVEGITPAPSASPETRLRRVYLDVIGILPTLAQIDAFLADPSDTAYAQVVDALLASPHFGERWGRYWLDCARYADSNGYSIDREREIWPYRDWVINAINEDLPFNEFVEAQLAGDLLPNSTRSQKVATGFHRNTMINQEGGIDKEEFRIYSIMDRVNTTGAVFLGLTLGCAKCHDHKYDPVYQDEYYKLFAFYNNDDEIDLALPTPEESARKAALQKEIDGITPARDAYREEALKEKLTQWVAGLSGEAVAKWGLKEKAAVVADRARWTEEQERLIQRRFLKADPTYQAHEKKIGAIKSKMPKVPKTMVLRKRAEPRETHRLEQGDFTRLAETVIPGTPAMLHPYQGAEFGSRLDLAHWIMDRGNPLTARVTVNRFWQYLFGRGLVETE